MALSIKQGAQTRGCCCCIFPVRNVRWTLCPLRYLNPEFLNGSGHYWTISVTEMKIIPIFSQAFIRFYPFPSGILGYTVNNVFCSLTDSTAGGHIK